MVAYVDALVREIGSYRGEEREPVDTVFFGGGTPSLLPISQTERILSALHSVFDIASDAEISSEANPGTVSYELLSAWREMGFNRLSFGMQSSDDRELHRLGRRHTHADTVRSVEDARRAGFFNINLDLMYALPSQTTGMLVRSLSDALSLHPTHLSVYGLQMEGGTPFYEMRDTLLLPDEETECEMWQSVCDILRANGFDHYEISNFARAGYACRHNLHYWREEEYIGFGLAAYSYYRRMRYGCDRDFDAYLARTFTGAPHIAPLSDDERAYETVMLGLRLREGVDDTAFAAAFGYSFLDARRALISSYEKAGYMTVSGSRFSLTERGMQVSLSILSSLLV